MEGMLHHGRWRRAIALPAVLALLAACAAPSANPTAVPTATPPPTATPSPTPAPTATPIPTPTPPLIDEALLHTRFTVLVAGEDQSASRAASGYVDTNTDALMLVTVSPDQSRIVMLSIPRDTVDVPLADGEIYHGKINAIARTNGLEALQGAVSALLDVPIDGYLKIDMDDLVTLVDAVGGIDVTVETHVVDAHVGIDLQPGPAHLDGATALAYSRTRADLDYARAARQQQVVLALARALVDPTREIDLGALLRGLTAMQTNLDFARLATYAVIGRRAANAEVSATVLQPPRFSTFVGIEPGTGRGWVMIPNVAEMRAYAREVIDGG